MSQWWAHFSRGFSAIMLTAILSLVAFVYVQARDVRDAVLLLTATVPLRFEALDHRVTALEAKPPLKTVRLDR